MPLHGGIQKNKIKIGLGDSVAQYIDDEESVKILIKVKWHYPNLSLYV